MKTTIDREQDVKRSWYIVDATDKPAGRLAVKVANVLRGKTKPTFTPHVDAGDFVIVVNAEKVKLTGSKDEQKVYKHFTGFPGGLKQFTAETVRARQPTRIITQAVNGMLPRTKQGRKVLTRLKVYAGAEHPHTAQQPKTLAV